MIGKKSFQSMQWKLVIIYILLIVFSMQVIGMYFIQSVEKYYLDNFDDTLKAQASLLSVNLEKYLLEDSGDNQSKSEEINTLVKNLFELNGVVVSIIDSNGIILSTSEISLPSIVGQKIFQVEVNRALLGTRDEAIRVDPDTGHRMKYLAVPIKSGNNVLGAVFMKASIENVYDTVYRINKILTTATLIALFITALLGFILSRTITKPIKEITRQAEKMTHGEFNQRVRVYSDDEIGRLGDTFNRMAARLNDAIKENEEEKEKLSSILTNMSDGVIATNESNRIIVANQRAVELISLEEEEIIGNYFTDVFLKLEIPDKSGSLLYEYERENELKFLKVTFNILHRAHHGEIGTIIVLSDVTKEQKLEQIRKDFVANVSHELRTPLTTIKSYLEALEDGAAQDPVLANRFIKVASNETDRMIRLVTELLQLSRLDEGKMKLKKSLVSIKEMVEDVVDRFSFQCKQRSIRLIVNLPEYLPTLEIDRDQIDQVLDNLFSNAIKYTKENGEIAVSAKINKNNLYMSVSDTGIGISNKHLLRLFERFYRVDKARSREAGGTGLGLSIAREIVKAHGGEIIMESEVNAGTTVTFYIPLVEGVVE